MGRCQLERDSLSFGSVAAVVELSQGGEGSAPNLLHATESTTAVPSRDIWPSADGLMTGGRKVCGDGALGLHSFGPRIRSSVWSRGGVGNAQKRNVSQTKKNCFKAAVWWLGERLVFLTDTSDTGSNDNGSYPKRSKWRHGGHVIRIKSQKKKQTLGFCTFLDSRRLGPPQVTPLCQEVF